MATATLNTSDNLLICVNCGAQYDTECPASVSAEVTIIPASELPLQSCRICDDPREFVPPGGQMFTTLERLRKSGKYNNVIEQHKVDPLLWEITTEQKFAIGQRAVLLQTPRGNVLWDLIAYLDQATVDKVCISPHPLYTTDVHQINELGGIEFIIISHPHFYTTWADWAKTFKCPVYLSERDANDWANRTADHKDYLKLLTEQTTELQRGLTAVIAGGHFPGSMFMHAEQPNVSVPSLFVADTILTIPSSRNPDPAKPGVTSYAFMWSIPNFIPLAPDVILQVWLAIKPYDFVVTYGLMKDIEEVREMPEHRMSLKQRVLESAKIHCRHIGYTEHAIMVEECD